MSQSNQRLSIEFVRTVFEEAGCKLISVEYKNARSPLEYICTCGTKSTIRYDNFRQGKRCNKCRYEKIAEKRRHSIEYVRRIFKEGNCKLLESVYINSSTPMKYECECGRESKINYSNFTQGQRCRDCFVERNSGEGSYMYKPELTDEHRLIGRNDAKIREWRREIFERDDYTCIKCGKRGGNINAHHINGYNKYPESRSEIGNGVTLCEECHFNFHKEYGFGDNTFDQMVKWVGGRTQ